MGQRFLQWTNSRYTARRMTFLEIWKAQFLGNTVEAWTLALVTFLVTFTVLPIARGFIASRRKRWIESGGGQLPDAIELAGRLVVRTSRLFLSAVAIYLASRYLTFPANVERMLTIVIVALFWMQAGLWSMAAVRFTIERRRKRSEALDAVLTSSIDIILFVAGLVVWTMVLLLALDNLGVEIKPLLAGLGIGGIAIALAVQTVLGDLLASLSIALDKPFTIGDFLSVDDFQGSVEHIGVKSTRLRSISGEQIVISNTDILKARVRNFGRMRERRAVFQIGVHYETPTDALAAIPAAIRSIVEAEPEVRFDRCHFLTFGDTALQFETVYIVKRADFNTYADIQQRINLAILGKLRSMSVQFAAPSRNVFYIENPAPLSQSSAGGK
jgi:small-conductance mechanosensitive channel